MNVYPVYVGFPTLEKWIAQLSPSEPVYAMKLAEPNGGEGGMTWDELIVFCCQPTGAEIRYCRITATCMKRLYGEPFDSDWRERVEVHDSLWEMVQAILADNEVGFVEATIARPKNLKYLNGTMEGALFDPERKRFVAEAA
jgi:hypothetical protein